MENINRMRILQTAHVMFNTRGYRSVTIKDLADKLGMSKKTIYQYFSSKEEIAIAVVEESMERINQVAKISELPNLDPIFVIKDILIHAKEESMRFGPLFLMDIEKYLPDLAHRYKQFRNEKKQILGQLLKSTQDMDMLKAIPIPLVTEILSVCLKALVKSDSFSQHKFSTADALDLFLDIFCNGIAASRVDRNDFKH